MHAGMPDAGHRGHHGKHKAGRAGAADAGMHPGLPFAGPGFDRLLDDIQATPEQRQQIRAITEQARKDLRALHEQGRAQHQGAMALWTSPKLDAAEAEKQRQQMLAHHDQVSKRMTQAMLDVGRVLTPEQRAQAAAQLKQRHERMQDRREQREQARAAGGERLQNHMLRRPAAASAPAPAGASAPSR
jgi:Spy/CpxP family protein refolding chaperone